MTDFTATYSPEDNKIRIYASTRLDAETFARVKDAGFKWAPKQELFVAPKWTPAREDLALQLAGEIEVEDMSLAERAMIKAERLDNLAHKRHAEAESLHNHANDLSQAFYMGQPILVGHHSERKARKTQQRMHSVQDKASKAEKLANYWLYRAEGVERFANMKNNPRVRANRIKVLLAELRDLQRGINDAHNALELWKRFGTSDKVMSAIENLNGDRLGIPYGAYSKRHELDMLELREKCLAGLRLRIEGPTRRRWIEHVLNRLAFERSMLGDVPRFAGELTPVIIQAFARTHGAEKPKCTVIDDGFFMLESPVPLPAHLSASTWLELSGEEWRDVMQACGYEVIDAKPRRVSSKPAPMALVNLSQDDADRLQRIWNLQMEASCKHRQTAETNNVKSMTQAQYSANSKGTYAPCKAIEIDSEGRAVRGVWRNLEFVKSAEPVARIRVAVNGTSFYKPSAVIHITDKPAKALPIDLVALEVAATLAAEARRAELAA